MKKQLYIYTVASFLGFNGLDLAWAQMPSRNLEPLKSIVEYEFSPGGGHIETVTIENRILNESGRSEASLFRIQYQNDFQKIEVISAETIHQNEVVASPISDLKVEQVKSSGAHGLSNVQEMIVPINKVSVGSVVRVNYRITTEPHFGNISSLSLGLLTTQIANDEQYLIRSKVPLTVIRTEPSSVYFKYSTEVVDGTFIYRIKATEIARSTQGDSEHHEAYLFSTEKSWGPLMKVQAENYEKILAQKLPQDFLNEVMSLGKLANDGHKIDQLSALINKRVAYSGNWTTKRGRFIPQDLVDSLKSGKGDCKDFAALLSSSLRKLGFKATPVLTFRSQSYLGKKKIDLLKKSFSPDVFDHVIVRVVKGNRTWWVDPTNPYVQADVIAPDILGNFGLPLEVDGTSYVDLPNTNFEKSIAKIKAEISILPDNSTSGRASLSFNRIYSNTIKMAERMAGEGFKDKYLGLILHAGDKDLKVLMERGVGGIRQAETFSFHSNGIAWIDEKVGQYKVLRFPSFLNLYLMSSRKNIGLDLGEPSIMVGEYLVKDVGNVDSILASCIVRSQWIDFDREVRNTAAGIRIVDRVETKDRMISVDELNTDIGRVVANDLAKCAGNSEIVLKLSPTIKTPQMLLAEKKRGSPVEILSEKEALELSESGETEYYSYHAHKLYRFYQRQLQEKKSQIKPSSLIALARATSLLGYIRGSMYVPEYLNEAISYLDLALTNRNSEDYEWAVSTKVSYLLLLGKKSEAQALYDQESERKGHYHMRLAAVDLASDKAQFEVAENILLLLEKEVGKDKKKRIRIYSELAQVYRDMKKVEWEIEWRKKLLALEESHWEWYNLALSYREIQKFDSAIEAAQKCLSIAPMPMAEGLLAKIYLKKAEIIDLKDSEVKAPDRMVASASGKIDQVDSGVKLSKREALEKKLSYLQLALKYDSKNEEVLLLISEELLRKFNLFNDRLALNVGWTYVNILLKDRKYDSRFSRILDSYKAALSKSTI